MNEVHVSIVLYGFDPQGFEPTLNDLLTSSRTIGRIWILLSGSDAEVKLLHQAISGKGLENKTIVIHRYDNLGFASGHNLLLRKAFVSNATACLVLNPDVRFTFDALTELVSGLDTFDAALFGPTLARAEPDQVTNQPSEADSLGIVWTRNGRHFDKGQGEPWADRPRRPVRVDGVTGACLMVPKSAYRALMKFCGYFFDDTFIAYREDAELGVRASALGISQWILPIDGFLHIRTTRGFTRSNDLINLLGVRNRYLIKWSLGPLRPGRRMATTTRDIGVALAVFVRERASLPGLLEAWRIRRYTQNRGKAWRSTALRVQKDVP